MQNCMSVNKYSTEHQQKCIKKESAVLSLFVYFLLYERQNWTESEKPPWKEPQVKADEWKLQIVSPEKLKLV